ncbi:MAG TPA: hypothetical protein VN703_02910 [Candidatus Sulfopaludibacter sp.]|nr:hypothetical protein [Candidatus Sulfopaludibacter sp.]
MYTKTEIPYNGYCIRYTGSGQYKIDGFTMLFDSVKLAKELIDTLEEKEATEDNYMYEESGYLQ